MNHIRLLDKQVSELIAAGEVVERPASAVKELLENSIDAGAQAVTLEIKNGGVAFIRVTDNGSGILREDVPNAFLRHATSKVRTARDLEAIGTLGFRGEALASIAAVSKVDLLTRTEEELAGTHLRVEGGEVLENTDAGCPRGTTIIVRELFYNTPARMKFLKKDISEANSVTAVAQRIALSHPEVSLRYIRDGKEEFCTPGDSRLLSAVRSTLGRDFAAALLKVEYSYAGVQVTGYAARPTASRSNRNMQFFFLNGRLVKSKTAMAALEGAYRNGIMTGRYPACVLALAMDPRLADVNVHPAKIEVRFVQEKTVFDAVYYGVKSALEADRSHPALTLDRPNAQGAAPFFPGESAVPTSGAQLRFDAAGPVVAPGPAAAGKVTGSPDGRIPPETVRAAIRQAGAGEEAASAVHDPVRAAYRPGQGARALQLSAAGSAESGESAAAGLPPVPGVPAASSANREDVPCVPAESAAEPAREAAREKSRDAAPFRVAGQCFGTYILVESGDELLLIDKHAAHERILYEKIRAARGADAQGAQMMLAPKPVTLPPAEYGAAAEHLGLLRQAGFDVEDFGGSTLLLRAAPLGLTPGEAEGALSEIAGNLLEHRGDTMTDKLDAVYHSVACRAAIKAGNRTGEHEAERLAARVLGSNDIRTCPHGRPVVISLRRREIEKQFGRIV